LFIAVLSDQPKVVQCLVSDFNVDVNAIDNVCAFFVCAGYILPFICVQTGWSALHYACYNGYYDVVQALLSHKDINLNCKTNVLELFFYFLGLPFSLGGSYSF
jgi:hypothetical protein